MKRIGKWFRRGVASILLFSTASYSYETSNFAMTTVVPEYCNMSSASDITLTYNPLDSTVSSASGSFSFQCNSGTTFEISASSGNNPAGSIGYLAHTDPSISDIIQYSLSAQVTYTPGPSVFATNIFDTPLSMTAPTNSPPTTSLNIVLISPSQDVHRGTYSDTVTLTISW